jgi:hypothetical protein
MYKNNIDCTVRLSKTLNDFSGVLTRHKEDREQLLLFNRERQGLIEKANRHAEASLLVLKENEVL